MINTQENSPVNSIFIVEKNRLAKLENTANFFTELKDKEAINTIYYPGPGSDDSLTPVFGLENITYIDRQPAFEGVRQGDFRKAEIPAESADAVFIQDIHEQPKDIVDFIRILKRGGILVYGLYGCGFESYGSNGLNYVKQATTLQEEKILENWQTFFRTFRKN